MGLVVGVAEETPATLVRMPRTAAAPAVAAPREVLEAQEGHQAPGAPQAEAAALRTVKAASQTIASV